MLTYFFVFGVVLRDRFDPHATWSSFALYFLAGMLPWLAFSEAAGRAPGVMLEHRNFVKKLVFAVETLPVNLVVAGLITELFAIVLFCVFLLAINHELPGALLWLPVLLIPQILFTAGVCWFLAALGVFVRDLGQIIGFLLTLWFFLTPICYPENKLPPAAARRADQESDLRSGARLPVDFPAESGSGSSARCGSCGCCRRWCFCWATPGSTSCASRSRICCKITRKIRAVTKRAYLSLPGKILDNIIESGHTVFDFGSANFAMISVPVQLAREVTQDARQTLRLWSRRPWNTGFAILALAIGIGANTGVFSVVNALLLRSLPFRDPGGWLR